MRHRLSLAFTALLVACALVKSARMVATALFIRPKGSFGNRHDIASFILFQPTLRGRCRSSIARTQYTIDEDVCSPTRSQVLISAVHKTCASLEIFLDRKPIAPHTKEAYSALLRQVGPDPPAIVLDSGCGTGRSTRYLSQLYPDHLVIGADRSFVRLTKTKTREWRAGVDVDDSEEDSSIEISLELESIREEESKRPFCVQIAENAYLVRAELVDFWRCCRQPQNNWTIAHHYLLYPNPYPTHARLTQRWYAHPSFPLILQLGAQSITIRSNWEGYLDEFAKAVEIADDYYAELGQSNPARPYFESALDGPVRRTNLTMAWTNFEKKYDDVGEPTFELKLEARP